MKNINNSIMKADDMTEVNSLSLFDSDMIDDDNIDLEEVIDSIDNKSMKKNTFEIKNQEKPLIKAGDEVKIHKQCLNDPYMSEPQMKALKYDLLINGQQESVKVVEKDGEEIVIDGKNRLKALQELEMDTFYEIVNISEKDIYSYRKSLNKIRKRYSKSQLACYAAEEKEALIKKNKMLLSKKMKELKKGNLDIIDDNIDTNKYLAQTWGVNHDYIAKATEIMKMNKSEFELIKKGEKKLLKSYKELKTGFNQKESLSPDELLKNYEDSTGRKLSELESNYIGFLGSSIIPKEKAIKTVINKLKQEYNDFKPEMKSQNQQFNDLTNEFLDFFKKEYDDEKYQELVNRLNDNNLLKISKKEKFSLENRIDDIKMILKDNEKVKLSRIIDLNKERIKQPIPEEKSLNGKIKYFIRDNYPYSIGSNIALDIYNDLLKVSEVRSMSMKEIFNDIKKKVEEGEYAN